MSHISQQPGLEQAAQRSPARPLKNHIGERRLHSHSQGRLVSRSAARHGHSAWRCGLLLIEATFILSVLGIGAAVVTGPFTYVRQNLPSQPQRSRVPKNSP